MLKKLHILGTFSTHVYKHEDISFQKYYSWHRTHEFNRNPQSSNTFLHLHLKLTFYGIRRRVFWWFNVTLRKKGNGMHEKTDPLYNEKRWLAQSHTYIRTWTLWLEKNNPKTNCEVTKCPTDTVLLRIISCMTPTLQLFLQYSLITTQEDIT